MQSLEPECGACKVNSLGWPPNLACFGRGQETNWESFRSHTDDFRACPQGLGEALGF